MKLYNLAGCPYCRIVRRRLAELGLTYETIEVPIHYRDRREVFEVSGQYLVPVLVDGENVLDDEDKILAYLEKRYGPFAKGAEQSNQEEQIGGRVAKRD